MFAYRLTGSTPRLTEVDLPQPHPGPGEVRVAVKAASLNSRDLTVANGAYSEHPVQGLIPLSDGAGVIDAVGPGVAGRKVGERVAIGFFPGWVDGLLDAQRSASALGGGKVDGVLRQWIVVPADGVTPIPETLSFEAAATLPCAGVTAWAALFEGRGLRPGETVLLQGTGGVSMFALQFAKLAGARVIVTSSSDEKLARARTLGADETINYRTTPDWAAEAIRLTGGVGVDKLVEVGGAGTFNQSLMATRIEGEVALIGVLSGRSGDVRTGAILFKRLYVHGISVGPVKSLATTVKVVTEAGIEPVIHWVFRLDEAERAYDALAAAGHMGKIVIRFPD